MKKNIALFVALVLFLVCLTSCKKCEHVDADDDLKCDLCGKDFDDGKEAYEFTTPVTDSLKLNESYEGKDFVTDGIGLATVVAYTDGDTVIFKTSGGHKVTIRFLGIDTPESTYKVEPWGFAASAFTKNALKNAKTIVLQSETLDEKERLDSTGKRYLGWVWADGRLLNLELAEVGLATSKAEGTQYASKFIEAIQPVMRAKERIYGVQNDPNFDYSSKREEYTIKQLRELYGTAEAISESKDIGKKVTITGTISKRFGSSSAYIQQADEDGNYYGIYLYGGYDQIKFFDEGTTITVNGTIGYYFGQLQISSVSNASIKVYSFTNKDNVVSTDMELKDISISNYYAMGNLVTINEEIQITGYYDSDNETAFTLKTNYQCSDGNYLSIRVDQRITLKDEFGDRITSGESFVGKTITSFTGVVSYYDPNFGSQTPEVYDGYIQLMWANYSDVIFK